MRMAVWVALGGGVTWLLGAGLNGLVIVANGGHMPVYARVASGDQLHVLAGAHVALGWLGDWISVSMISLWALGASSPGDYLIWAAELLTPVLVALAVAFRLLQRFD